MKKQLVILASLGLLSSTTLLGCAQGGTPEAQTGNVEAVGESTGQTDTTSTSASGEMGTLNIVANGEDFVRQGFVSKDGWNITFDHVYVNLAAIDAYQTDPPYDAQAGGEIKGQEKVSLSEAKTVDLAQGDENAEPILVAQVPAPPGQYNALSWKMTKANSGPASGYPLVMIGTAEKDGETVNFTLKLDEEMTFSCGEFVGDERKGFVKPGDAGELEATFHFDHIFGDGSAPPDDEINTGALGFEPLANLATDGEVNMDMGQLQQALSESEYRQLQEIMPSLGHVGEGHCHQSESV
ncbi:DUF4382 domain-containing protein [Phormidium sp. CCY1219]|uniref:DUF4382 domain-containing protein n=1 Tax=Phormidium sp. CCY1219 TaxID=2886104 RepID=UPI002D1F91C9|nr:DUF4382 domain-containing protein [Phormidium sp. CCY1219]MEB3830156.1 DUF4382 domain-containing protein [Phormidium sp. CCY1219]